MYTSELMEQVLRLHATKKYTVYEIAGIVKRPHQLVIQVLKDADLDVPRANAPDEEQIRKELIRRRIEEHQEKLYAKENL